MALYVVKLFIILIKEKTINHLLVPSLSITIVDWEANIVEISCIDLLHGQLAVSIPVTPGLHDEVHQGVLVAVCAQAQHHLQGRPQLSLRDLPVPVNIQGGQLG